MVLISKKISEGGEMRLDLLIMFAENHSNHSIIPYIP
jgi:hypothetical protein